MILHQVLRRQAPLFEGAGAKVLNQNIGCGDQAAGQILAFRDPQIRRHRLLVAGHNFPPERIVAPAPSAHGIADLGGFDLDDLCPHIAEQLAAEGTSNELAHFDNAQPLERAGVCDNGVLFHFRHDNRTLFCGHARRTHTPDRLDGSG